jgi:DNA-binding NarL/FixJ family response regulator
MTVVGEVTSMDEARSIEGADAYLVAARGKRTADRRLLIEALTAREMQVLELLAEGLPNKAIAARLDISDQTVKFHVASICGKLGASNRTEAVRRAVARGILTL